MNTNKLLIGTLIGGVAFFLLGFLLYVIAFGSTLSSLMPGMAAIERSEPDMVALVIGNLVLALLIAYIFEKWASIRTFMGGLIAGATLGFLMALSYDSILHGTTTMATWGGVILDAVIFAIMCGLGGGIIGWWLGYNRK